MPPEYSQAVGPLFWYSCPPVIEITKLFEFTGERANAEKTESVRKSTMVVARRRVDEHVTHMLDMVYLGALSEMLTALEEFENMVI